MKVVWLPPAESDVRQIYHHIAADNPRAAEEMLLLFRRRVASLATLPRLGKPWGPRYRELVVHRSYRLMYRLDAERVWILKVLHTARRVAGLGRPA